MSTRINYTTSHCLCKAEKRIGLQQLCNTRLEYNSQNFQLCNLFYKMASKKNLLKRVGNNSKKSRNPSDLLLLIGTEIQAPDITTTIL